MELQELCEKLLKNGTVVEKLSMEETAEDKGLSFRSLQEPVHEKLNDKSSVDSAVVHSSSIIDEAKREARESEQENKCNIFMKQNKIMFWAERVILFSICAAVAGGFTVPVIIYAVSGDRGNTTRLSRDLRLFDSCSNTVTQVCKCTYV